MRIDERFRNRINFRDLGGLETNDNKKVKKGYFYRGAGLSFFDEDELKEFKKLNIKTIMDLRSNYEINKYPDPEIEGANYIQHNGLVVNGSEDIDWSPNGMKKIGGEAIEQLNKIKKHYQKIAFNNNAYKLMMNEIKNNNLPIYIHCATGKDRTGVGAYIILLALNVKKEEIKKDFLLSNEFRKDILETNLDNIKDETKDHPELIELMTLFDGVLESTFNTVFDSIESKYSSYDEYLMDEYELSKENLKKLREKYTE